MAVTFTLEAATDIVHMVREVKCEKATRRAEVKCGAVIYDDSNTRPMEWSSGNSRVTCPNCLIALGYGLHFRKS